MDANNFTGYPVAIHGKTDEFGNTHEIQYVAVPMEWVAWVTHWINTQVAESNPPSLYEGMQAAADYNRDHAGEKFGEQLRYDPFSNEWVTREDNEPVIFTPYGWRKEKEVMPNG